MNSKKRVCMMGVFVGDTIGTSLESIEGPLSVHQVDLALKMNGDRTSEIVPGQISDDGELTLTLWRTLAYYHPTEGFPVDDVITEYAEWYLSKPKSIGETCRHSFQKALSILEQEGSKGIGAKIKEYVKDSKSKSNGALMRVTPIAQWVAPFLDITPEAAANFARSEAELSHPAKECVDANAVYTFALVNLLRGMSPTDTLGKTKVYIDIFGIQADVRSWFTESANIDHLDCTKSVGFVKYAFTMAFYFLRHPEIKFEQALHIVLMKGGDLDTNAAIVGGMVSAYHDIPIAMADAVLKFDCVTSGIRRHAKFSVRRVLRNF